MTLIKSLTEESGAPQAKRRKLDHQTRPNEKAQDEPPEPEKEQIEDVDFVEEAEEANDDADAEEAVVGDDEDEELDASDPFDRHFVAIDEGSITRRLKAIEEGRWSMTKTATKGTKVVLNSPDTGDKSDQVSAPAPIASASELSLKHRLKESMAGKHSKFDAIEQSLAPYVFGYNDLLFCNRNMSRGKSIRRLACLHALNHVFK